MAFAGDNSQVLFLIALVNEPVGFSDTPAESFSVFQSFGLVHILAHIPLFLSNFIGN
jgi:hypothetical protein